MRIIEKSIARALLAAVAALASGAALLLPFGAAGPAAGAEPCAAMAVFETDGYNIGESLANWNRSYLNTHRPADWQIVQIPYDAGVFPVVDGQALDASVAEGSAKLERAVRDLHAACPGTHLLLAGYSEGAAVAGDVLRRFANSSDIPHDQISGVLYGDPRRPFGDGGVGGIAGGIETNLPTLLPGVTMRGPRDFGDLQVREVCNENDGICNSANMITNALAFANGLSGYANGDHGYPLDVVGDQGNGPKLVPQAPRIGYGAPLPLPIGTPWQLQQQLGGSSGGDGSGGDGSARQAAATARATVLASLDHATAERLAGLPWFRLLVAA